MVFINTTILLVLVAWAVAWFFVAVYAKRNDLADVVWGLGFILVAWSAYYLSSHTLLALVVNSMVTVWGLRLAWHIGRRFVQHDEDARYAQWRSTWKYFHLRSFLQVFLLQTGLVYLVATPFLYINSIASPSHTIFTGVGVTIWVIGFVYEMIADAQLRNFLADTKNHGQIMDQGLWRYSRHPNYFGEVLLWWGIFIIAVNGPLGMFTIIGPLTITVLILFVSGIPMLEQRYADDPAYAAYKKRTSIFFPLLPKKS